MNGMDTMEHSEDPDKMQSNAAFHQDLHYLLKRERSVSVVECLTRDRGATGSSLTDVTVLCP